MGNKIIVNNGVQGEVRAAPVTVSARPARGALTKTGGFLAGFTHTLQPYIGCRFGCEYCYVKGLGVHRFHQPAQAWGSYVHPRTGIAEYLRKELSGLARRGKLDEVAIFMSSSTDPYQPVERRLRLARSCLEVLAEFPPRLLVVQTRSPLVEDDFALVQALGPCCWLSFTLETDLDAVRAAMTPLCPGVERRLATMRAARAAGIQVQAAVSPCLPYSGVETFGRVLLDVADRVVVDTYTSGDGQQGKRTAATQVPALYAQKEWGGWQEEEKARALYGWLAERMGERAGWSQAGFTALTRSRGPLPLFYPEEHEAHQEGIHKEQNEKAPEMVSGQPIE
jgi:DNA repair photolyase